MVPFSSQGSPDVIILLQVQLNPVTAKESICVQISTMMCFFLFHFMNFIRQPTATPVTYQTHPASDESPSGKGSPRTGQI